MRIDGKTDCFLFKDFALQSLAMIALLSLIIWGRHLLKYIHFPDNILKRCKYNSLNANLRWKKIWGISKFEFFAQLEQLYFLWKKEWVCFPNSMSCYLNFSECYILKEEFNIMCTVQCIALILTDRFEFNKNYDYNEGYSELLFKILLFF